MIIPSLEFPRSPPVALGGTTSAAQITAARGNLAAQVRAGSAVYGLLRWNTGLNAWESIRLNSEAVSVEPIAALADGTATTVFTAIPQSYYTAMLLTSQPAGDAANLLGLDIENAGPVVTPLIILLSGNVTGPSNNNLVSRLQDLELDLSVHNAGEVLTVDSLNAKIISAPTSGGSSAYVPGVPSDWEPPPTTISGGLDQLAARMTIIETLGPRQPAIAGSALAVGVPIYLNSAGKMLTIDGTPEVIRFRFQGFTATAAAADGDQISVASLGVIATDLPPVVTGKGYFVSGALVGLTPFLLFSEDELSIFLDPVTGAAAGSWYRFVGTAVNTNSIKEAWGEPLQVTGP